MSNNSNLVYLGAWLVIPSSILVSHTILPLPPALIFFIFSLLIFLFQLKNDNFIINIKNRDSISVLPLILYLLFTQPLTDSPLRRYIAAILGPCFFILATYFLLKLENKKILKLADQFINYSAIFLFLDTIYRYIFPSFNVSYLDNDSLWFYQYKGPSLMTIDSNGTGIMAVIMLFFSLYWNQLLNRKKFFSNVVFLLIIAFSISRAAWFATFIGLFYFYLFRNKSLKYKLSIGCSLVILLIYFIIVYIIPIIQNDASFLTKFDIINASSSYFSTKANFESLLIGVGCSISIEKLGIFAHNYFLVFIIEMGIPAFLFMLFSWFKFVSMTKGKALIVLVPFFIVTLSSFLTFGPFFYAVMALINISVKKSVKQL